MPRDLVRHPGARARLARALRGLRNVKGWRRAASIIAGQPVAPTFRVRNDGRWIEGDLTSFIERQAYLFGGYESDEIGLFLSRIDRNRHGVILDIGANIGTHAMRFAESFDQVHAFEPNPVVFNRLMNNLLQNPGINVTAHPVGLGDEAAVLTLRSPAGKNAGLGTFMTDDQYDAPLATLAEVRVERGDDYLATLGVTRVDAIKCDVQGFERAVLQGLQDTIQRDRPLIWIELGSGAYLDPAEAAKIVALLPRPVRMYQFTGTKGRLTSGVTLVRRELTEIRAGDFVIELES